MTRVRIAPSPTGDPHVGTAYIALFNLVLARQGGGQFVLRIEDTDRARSKPEWEQMIFDALKWCGLQWDEGPDVGGEYGPYRQSERGTIYAEHAQILMDKGEAYRCFCTPERLDALRKEQRERKENPGYDGLCIGIDAAEAKRRADAGESHVVRLKVPREGQTSFTDELRGEVTFENAQVDHQVLLKSDGMPTYHLANVVDDHLMKITHVMRAEEWITSTPKHVLLYKAFGWEQPKWIHMPLLRNADKSKISKRKNPVSLNYYRDAGFLPEALVNYLGMMGWTMPDGREQFTFDDMVEHFTLERMSLGGPVFDVQKLTWLNGVTMRERDVGALATDLREGLFSEARLKEIAPLMHERIDTLEEFIDKAGFFFVGDVAYDEDAQKAMVPKGSDPKSAAKLLEEVLGVIDSLPVIEREGIEAEMRALCERLETKPKFVFMPTRVAVTGRRATPGLFETMEVLGKERCRRRLRNAIKLLKSL